MKRSRPSAGLTKAERSEIARKARAGHMFGKKTTFKDVERKAYKQYGSEKKAKAVAGTVFWRAQAAKKAAAKKSKIRIPKAATKRELRSASKRAVGMSRRIKNKRAQL
jgi:phage gp29-like protein